MRFRVVLVAVAAGVIVVATASPASAKGADQATITGPGLSKPIVIGGDGEPGSMEGLGQLSEGTGMFVAMFGPDAGTGQQLSPKAPAVDLGPKYLIEFRVPGANPKPDMLRQDLYPMAPGGPVTYTAADQSVFDGKTGGGWYQGTSSLTVLLRQLGVPVPGPQAASATPPATSAGDASNGGGVRPGRTPWPLIVGIVASAVVLLAGAALFVRRHSVAQS
jgi:hypothetical protein